MVFIAVMAQTDGNNPMTEIGIPFDVNSFNIYALGAQAPQLQLIQPINQTAPVNETQKVCWISWWCPDLPSLDDVARAIYSFSISFANLVFTVVNAVLWGGTVTILLIANFLNIFNFAAWGAFQSHIFLILFGVGLTSLLGGSIMLWIFAKVMGSIPFVGGVP